MPATPAGDLFTSSQVAQFATAEAFGLSQAQKRAAPAEGPCNGAVLSNTRVVPRRPSSHGRILSTLGGAVRRAATPIRAALTGGDALPGAADDDLLGRPAARKERPWGLHRMRAYRVPGAEELAARPELEPATGGATSDSGDGSGAESLESPEQELRRLRAEVTHLRKDLDHQGEQRKLMQASLASERSRCESLARHNEELLQAAEERLMGQQRVSAAETSELSSQVDALLLVKKQLFQRIQAMDAERSRLIAEREDAAGERLCVACMDRLANTVLMRCRHLVCCESCARKVGQCPICRQPVKDRLTVFML